MYRASNVYSSLPAGATAVVASSGNVANAQAVATLRLALPGIGAVALPQAVFLTQPVADIIDEDGNLSDELKKQTFGPETNLEMQLQTLVRYAKALKNL